jgi:hypothetical protein
MRLRAMNIVDDAIWRLAQLASLSFQERYVIGGTRDEHILDVDLLEEVLVLKYRVHRPENEAALTDTQRGALEDLWAYIEALSDDALSAESRDKWEILIREGTVWKTLRAKAAAALKLFGLPAEISVEEVERLIPSSPVSHPPPEGGGLPD